MRREFVEPEHAVDIDDAGGEHVDVAGDEGAQGRRHAGLDLEPDHRAAPPELQRAFVEAHQVLGLLLDLDVAVADDPKTALPDDAKARKQQAAEGDDGLLQRDEAVRAAAQRLRQLHQPLDAVREPHQRAHRPPVVDMGELQRQREAEVGDERERMRGVDRERRQQREDMQQEMILQPFHLGFRKFLGVDDGDAGLGEFGAQLLPARLLRRDQGRDAAADAFELFGGGAAVLGKLGHARRGPDRRGRRRGP